MFKLLLRLLINAVAIWVAAQLVQGVSLHTENVVGVIAVALVFGIVNAVLKPIAKFFSFPFIVVTLGIFSLLINAALFGLVAWVTDALTVDGFFPALWGSIIVGVVGWLLGLFLDDNDDDA